MRDPSSSGATRDDKLFVVRCAVCVFPVPVAAVDDRRIIFMNPAHSLSLAQSQILLGASVSDSRFKVEIE